MPKILIIEDDPVVAQSILDWAESQHHTAELVETGPDGLDRLKFYSYDMAILDWGLPGMSGLEVLASYRNAGGIQVPILMLTGRGSLSDKEIGLDSGADDYLTKPFDIRELAARIRALLRRPTDIAPTVNGNPRFGLDHHTYSLVRNGEKIKLLPKEFAIVEFLMRHQGQFFAPEQILNHVWESNSESTVSALRTCIKRLRQRIERDNEAPVIVTSRGYGYKLDLPKDDGS